ncbi:MAG: hypothetical protein AAF702_40135 [Chloroflexota bacterium]
MTSRLTFETMEPLLNEQFELHFDSTKTFDIELVEVAQLPDPNRAVYSWQKQDTPSKSNAFTLVFRVPQEVGPTQKTYEISHSSWGALVPIFLVPIAGDEKGLYFEAVFT